MGTISVASERLPIRVVIATAICVTLLMVAWTLAWQSGNLSFGHGDAQTSMVTTGQGPVHGGPYLTDIPGKPRAGVYFEGRRLVAGYAGPSARYRRSCDGAVMDVGFMVGSDNLDLAALDAWRTRAPCNIYTRLSLVQVYDQDEKRPPLAAADRAGEAGTDPRRDWAGRLGSLQQGARSATVAFSGEDGAFSALLALQVMAGVERSSLWSLVDLQGREAALYTGGGTGPAYRSGRLATPDTDTRWLRDPQVALRSNPTVIGWTSSADTRSFFARGRVASRRGRFASTPMASFRIGVGGPSPVGSWARFGVVLWQAPLDPAEMEAAIAQVNRAMAFPVHFDAMAVMRGDSILYGAGAEGFDQRGPGWFLAQAMPTVELFDLGMKAQLLAHQIGPDFDAVVAPLLATSPYGPSRTAILWQSGTNDIGRAGRSAAQLIADSAAAVRQSRAALPGVHVLRSTLLPRDDAGWAVSKTSDGMSKEDARQAVNAAWRGGASGADRVIDIADPRSTMGAPRAPGDTAPRTAAGVPIPASLYADRLHPSSVGYASGLWQGFAEGLRAQRGQ